MTQAPRHLVTAALVVALVALPIPPSSAAASPTADPARTLADLQAAFNGESNAHARYLSFAEKAASEGYGDVASLFRAAAKAEEVHARNHAAVIEKLGGVAKAEIETPEPKTTRENLEAAVAGETYERDTMYPEFLAQARADRNRDAIETFNQAKTAEAEHAKLYRAALDDLASLAGTEGKTYYVCEVCGFTVTRVDFSKCPSCFSPKERYLAVA